MRQACKQCNEITGRVCHNYKGGSKDRRPNGSKTNMLSQSHLMYFTINAAGVSNNTGETAHTQGGSLR